MISGKFSTIYINGLNYLYAYFLTASGRPVQFNDLDMGKVKELIVGGAAGVFDELKIFSRVLKDAEISAEYHRFFPYDLNFDKSARTFVSFS